MSIKTMTRVWDTAPLKGGQLLLLIAIADFAHDDGFAWPGIETLSKKIRMSHRHTRRMITILETSGQLYIERSTNRNRYIITTGLTDPEIIQSLQVNLSITVAQSLAALQKIHIHRGGQNVPLDPDKMSPSPGQNVPLDPDKMSPYPDKMSPHEDIAMSPEPLLTINEPSVEPLKGAPSAPLPQKTDTFADLFPSKNTPPPPQKTAAELLAGLNASHDRRVADTIIAMDGHDWRATTRGWGDSLQKIREYKRRHSHEPSLPLACYICHTLEARGITVDWQHKNAGGTACFWLQEAQSLSRSANNDKRLIDNTITAAFQEDISIKSPASIKYMVNDVQRRLTDPAARRGGQDGFTAFEQMFNSGGTHA